ncbi:alpha-D-ribose 1-methylphosphonate 5-triphosphate diphosphatase [Thalassococcus sp. S3]|uniref:alpha-D-ribose 1-methylphosphonate 5-triphosphate diphosphatase n=1 Tax=Thalassococcus sp. S3 TaxID=2017482 RepID=UPI001024377F|nr:alpha-D-ribose 1-methylphosphonate 5-triphosphate diphosphatase [Thalassococcus sp. S3]QBF30915.1 alpha-D-ribose 1-methylphosphonate 5-triphosphate diphosphatase [Thalassococcus sp. S3]
MTALEFDVTGAEVLFPSGLRRAPLSVAGGCVVGDPVGRVVDLSGYRVMPGIVDVHGDGFERHMAPRRGAMKEMDQGLIAAEAELAANGITTAVMAQFMSWEGGLRGEDFADQVFMAMGRVKGDLVTDIHPQLRFETHLLEAYETLPDKVARWQVGYVVFNDHLPHDRLAEGRRPKSLTGQALKAGRNPEAHLALLQRLHENGPDVPTALDRLTERLAAQSVRMGSHDDASPEARAVWRGRGVRISEFPETLEAAEAACAAGDAVLMGSPNVVRGGSHKGNVSAVDLVAMGLCDALASDYHYPSPRRAALMLARSGVCDLARAWGLISAGPARVLGFEDRGALLPGQRADLVVLEGDRVAATFAAGRVSYMAGDVAARFFN